REAEFFTCLVRDQLVALRYWRRSGTAPEGLAKDLALYRRWRRQSRAAAAQFRVEIRPSAGDAP
ncbi:MAG: hypothetical protein ACREE3_11655, partial [Stellaceae bacterium]